MDLLPAGGNRRSQPFRSADFQGERTSADDVIPVVSSSPTTCFRPSHPWTRTRCRSAYVSQLVEAELLYQQGMPPQATYIFKHALIQETAYQSLLRSMRQ